MSCRGVECFGRPNEAEPRETSARARERASTAQHRVTAYAHSVSVFYILTRTHTTSVLKRCPLQSRDHDQGVLGGTHKALIKRTRRGRCAAAHTCCLFTRHAPRPGARSRAGPGARGRTVHPVRRYTARGHAGRAVTPFAGRRGHSGRALAAAREIFTHVMSHRPCPSPPPNTLLRVR